MHRIASIFCLLLASNFANAQTMPEKQAQKVGIKQCLPTISKISKHLIGDSNHANYDTNAKVNPDSRSYFSHIVKSYSDGETQITFSVTPTVGGKCDWAYTEIMLFEKSCGILREEIFKDFKFDLSLNETTIVLKNTNASVFVYLTPSKSNKSCLVTKEETGYE